MAAYKELRKDHDDVFLDLSKESNVMKIRGKADALTAFKDEVAKINVTMEKIQLTGREAGMVVGKGGANIKALTEKFDVGVDVKKINDESSSVEIVGISVSVAEAVKEIKEMLFQNDDIDSAVVVSNLFRNQFLEKSGSLIKELQKEVNLALSSNAVRLQFEGRDKDGGDGSSCAILEIKAPRMIHSSVVELVKQRVAECESKALTIKIEPHLVPKIIGKGGVKINEMKKMGKGANIEIDGVMGEISVMASDDATKKLIKTAIENIIAENQILKIPVESSMMPLVFGSPGKGLRSKQTQKEVHMKQEGLDAVLLTGSIENIAEAAIILREFIASNYTIEVHFDASDAQLFARRDSILKNLETEGKVRVFLARNRNLVEIRGTEENANAAALEVKKFLYGGEGLCVLKISVPSSIIGAIIGKGGNNISKLEKEHEGAKIDVNSSVNVIAIRGSEEVAYLCRGTIMKEMVKVQASETLRVDVDAHEDLSKTSTLRTITNDLPVSVTFSTSHVKLRGNCVDVLTVKAAVVEFVSGSYEGHLALMPTLYDQVQAAAETKTFVQSMQEDTMTTAEFEKESHSLRINGKKSNVKRAKAMFLDFMESRFSPYSSKVLKVPKHLAKVAGDAKIVTGIAADSGCDISFDHDMYIFSLHAASPERLAKGLESIERHVQKCEKLVGVLHIDPSDSWILGYLLSTHRDSLKAIEESSECKVDVCKDELVVSITGKESDNAESGKEGLTALLEKVKKENAFADLPESSMPQFVGQSSRNLNSFAAVLNVHIERVKKAPSRIRIHGNEAAVASATNAVHEWIHSWEEKNKGTTIEVDDKTLACLLDPKPASEKKRIAHDCGVKIDVYGSKSSVTIRGGKGNSHELALEQIKALVESHSEVVVEAEKEIEAIKTETPAPAPVKVTPAPAPVQVTAAPAPVKVTLVADRVGIPTVPAVIVRKQSPKEPKTKEVAGKQTVAKLYSFLVSEDAAPATTSAFAEPWDSSTVSSAMENVEEGYFRSTSGFTIRL